MHWIFLLKSFLCYLKDDEESILEVKGSVSEDDLKKRKDNMFVLKSLPVFLCTHGDTTQLQIPSGSFSKLSSKLKRARRCIQISLHGPIRAHSPNKDLGHCRIISVVPSVWRL